MSCSSLASRVTQRQTLKKHPHKDIVKIRWDAMYKVSRNLSSTNGIHKMVVLSLKGFQRSMTQRHPHTEVLETVCDPIHAWSGHLHASGDFLVLHMMPGHQEDHRLPGMAALGAQKPWAFPLDPSLCDLLPKNFVSTILHPLFQCHPRGYGWPALQTHCSLLPVLKIESYAKVGKKKKAYMNICGKDGRMGGEMVEYPWSKMLGTFFIFFIFWNMCIYIIKYLEHGT